MMIKKLGCEVKSGLKEAANQSCSYVKNNPWTGIGAGVAVGLLVGLLFGKK